MKTKAYIQNSETNFLRSDIHLDDNANSFKLAMVEISVSCVSTKNIHKDRTFFLTLSVFYTLLLHVIYTQIEYKKPFI